MLLRLAASRSLPVREDLDEDLDVILGRRLSRLYSIG
jgi:hypothetical protein